AASPSFPRLPGWPWRTRAAAGSRARPSRRRSSPSPRRRRLRSGAEAWGELSDRRDAPALASHQVCREGWSAASRHASKEESPISPALALALFVVSLAVTLGAAALFADRLDHVGPRVGLSEPLVGLLTALAADAPEPSSPLGALSARAQGVGMGVVRGSGVFNLAAMIGASAIIAGAVHLTRRSLLVEGAVALFAAVIAGGLILDLIPAGVATAAFLAVAVPYVVMLGRGRLHTYHPAA